NMCYNIHRFLNSCQRTRETGRLEVWFPVPQQGWPLNLRIGEKIAVPMRGQKGRRQWTTPPRKPCTACQPNKRQEKAGMGLFKKGKVCHFGWYARTHTGYVRRSRICSEEE